MSRDYLSTRELARSLDVSVTTIKYWLARYPEIKKFARIVEKPMRIYYRWDVDAPEKIRRFFLKQREAE